MQQPVNIQLAVQGGGAKLAALVAAMAAIEQLEKDGVIRVTRVAGTSAGSIVGAFFAARIPMEVVRQELLSVAPRLVKEYRIKGWFRTVGKIVFGKSMWRQGAVEKVLVALFEKS